VNVNRQRFSRLGMSFSAGLMLLAPAACNFSSPNKTLSAQSKGATKPSGPQFDGGKYCVETMTQNPPGPATPIHFSYKENESDGSSKDFEADFSGDTFDRTITERHPATDMDRKYNEEFAKVAPPVPIRDGFAENRRTIHYTRDDKSSWTEGWGAMEQGGTPWSLFVLKPTVTPAGSENIGGFETLKYVVDTSHQSQLDKYAGNWGWDTKDYNITGTAWVAKVAGCVLQYSIDLEKTGKDGKVSKAHYEGGVTKK